jgi:ubiquinone/menaquinone biosynthesis C-methylase UbiE
MNDNLLHGKKYLPAAGRNWLLPLYDPLTSFFGLDRYYYKLLKEASLLPTQKILDIGCGTGSLGKIIKETLPEIEFVGIDPDVRALAIAIKKLDRFSKVQFDVGMASHLPYTDATFDHVLSSFVFHLDPQEKIEISEEAKRVLKLGGQFHSIDFVRQNKTREDVDRSVYECLSRAGFRSVEIQTENRWPFGPVSFYSAKH